MKRAEPKLIGRLMPDGGLEYPNSMTEEEAWEAYANDMAALGLRWSREDGDGPGTYYTEEELAEIARERGPIEDIDPPPFMEGKKRPMYESNRRAARKYQKEKSTQISLVFRLGNADDMRALERIRSQKSHSAYVRRLVLEDIAREEQESQDNDN